MGTWAIAAPLQSPHSLTISSIQGHIGCPTWQRVSKNTSDPTLSDTAAKNIDFYSDLFNKGPLQGTLDNDTANFFNAYDIYNLVNYEFTHNETVFANLSDSDATLSRLAENAYTMERAMSDPGSSTANDTDSIALTIAGRTLARSVAEQMNFNANRTEKYSREMTLMFGSFQPLMALFSVAGLLTRDNVLSAPLGNVTAPGAAIVFELVGEDPDDSSKFPKPEDLSVRFVYRPTTDEDAAFQVFSLFGSGFDGRSIPYQSFLEKMTSIGRTATEWCQVCKPGSTTIWCQDVPSSGDDNGKKSKDGGGHSGMKPAVAGVIGAVIMGALVGLAALALCGLGGFRFQRRGRAAKGRPGDQDVYYGNGGKPQERGGSWEMGGGGQNSQAGAGDYGQDLHVQQQKNPFEYDTGSDVGGHTPVRTREGF